MLEQINRIVATQLEPLTERISELESQLEERDRLARGLIRIGKVSAHSDDNHRIKVKHGENETPFIKWFAACAGEVVEYRLPSIGEQAVLLNVGGGDNSSMTIALIGVPSDQFPLPTKDPDEILRVYPDGTRVSYNKKKSKLNIRVTGDALVEINKSATLNVDGDATVNVGGKTKVTSGGNATVDAPKVLLNGGEGVVTGAHKCMVTGLPHGDCSKTVMAGA